MTSPKQHLIHWLRDAHAMEQQAEKMLESQVERLEHYPQLRTRLLQHADETRGQIQKIEICLKSLGESPSSLKDAMGKMMAMAQTIGGMMASDEVVKGAIAGYVFEQGEIANYRALITAAEVAGEPQVAKLIEEILVEEEAMAQWLQTHLPETVRTFMLRDATDSDQASR